MGAPFYQEALKNEANTLEATLVPTAQIVVPALFRLLSTASSSIEG